MAKDQPIDVILVLESDDRGVLPVSDEQAAYARALAAHSGGRIRGVMCGARITAHARAFARRTGIDIIGWEGEILDVFEPDAVAAQLASFLHDSLPAVVVLGHTAAAMELAPRLAVAAQYACVTGVLGFQWAAGRFEFRRAVYGGKLEARIRPAAPRAVITIQPGGMTVPDPAPSEAGHVEIRPLNARATDTPLPVLIDSDDEMSALDDADAVVAAGNGVGEEENIDLVRRLAACFSRSAVAGSRPVCDRGWLPYSAQVGLTGKTISPDLYIACGISGAFQHVLGFREAGTVVAINRDSGAAIFQAADVGIAAPLESFLPILIEEIQQHRGEKK